MAVTQTEVLEIFSQVGSIKNSDQFLIISASQDGSVRATKITAELVRAYLNSNFSLTVDEDGYLWIGGVKTESQAVGITPQLQRGNDGIYCSTDNGETWFSIAYFSDFMQQNVLHQTQQNVSLVPNILNVWGNVTSLTVSLVGEEEGKVNEYMLEFTVASNNFSLTLPNEVRWAEEPVWENGGTYQVSILNGLAIYAGWE